MDMDFDPVAAKILYVTINMAAAREHMGEIKREIRVVKYLGQAKLNTLPFKTVSKLVIIKLVYFTVLWHNDFPEKTVMSEVYSPREIISGRKVDFKLHCRMEFGE